MPAAICDNKHVMHWSNRRGSHLSEMRCPQANCGLPLHQARYDYETKTYVMRESVGAVGRKFEHCAICGKRRSVPGGGRRVEYDTVYFADWPHQTEEKTIKAGSVVCWHHTPKTMPIVVYQRQ